MKSNGVIIIKENTASTEEIVFDKVDSSVTRPVKKFRELFTSAGLECYRIVKQNNFPKGIYAVYMFALKPMIITKKEEQVTTGLEKLNISDSGT